MKPPAQSTEKVPLVTKLAFGAGDLGPAIATAIMSFFLLIFFTDVARLEPAAAGTILLLTKLWDSVNDPIIGTLSDRIQTRWGRRRPWFLFGAIPFGLCFWLLLQVPDMGPSGLFWYYLIVMLALDTAFTIVNVPYTALTPELTNDYDERTSLNSYRFAFSIVGGLIAAVLHPIIVDSVVKGGGTTQQGYSLSATVWAVVATLPFFFAFWGTYERHTATDEKPIPFIEGLRTVFGNRAFRYVTGIYLLSWLVIQSVSTLIIYFLTYWMHQSDIIPMVILSVQGSALVWLFIWGKISDRVGKKGVYYRGMIFWILVSLALYAVQPTWPAAAMIVMGLLAGVGVATAYLVPWAMLPDVIELDELETGQRREGIYYGFFVLLQKVGLALGLFLISTVLSRTGYITPTEAVPTPEQPTAVLQAIRLMIGPIPALILAAGIVLVHRFPITREAHEQTLATLAARRAEASDSQSSTGSFERPAATEATTSDDLPRP